VYPQALHRFVGYLEETAVVTYTQVIQTLQTPGTQLNEEGLLDLWKIGMDYNRYQEPMAQL
jgi:hypothetical protein